MVHALSRRSHIIIIIILFTTQQTVKLQSLLQYGIDKYQYEYKHS